MCVPLSFYAFKFAQSLEYWLVYHSLESRCLRCELGKVVSTEGTCVDECTNSEIVLHYSLSNSDVDSYVNQFMRCSPRTTNDPG